MLTRLVLVIYCLALCADSARAQAFVSGLGGFAALSGGAATQANPPAASNYDAKVGPAFNLEAGYHFNDWISLQAGYIWNRSQVVFSELAAGGPLVQRSLIRNQSAAGGDFHLYFRRRSSWVRPYLSIGPSWVRIGSENKPGMRVAVGVDLMHKSGWGFRYTFSEMMTANALGRELQPVATPRLMNFQNLFGVIKQF